MSGSGEEPGFTPPRWLNALMRVMLKTPLLQRIVGRKPGLLTYTGRRSGRVITIPVTCVRDDDRAIVSSHVARQWWRNLGDRPDVRLRLAGSRYVGRARLLEGDAAVDAYARYVEHLPMVAKASKIPVVDGVADLEEVRSALETTKVIEIGLERVRV